jgi:tetratricopeptide (TPR) repeat protein
MIKAHTPGRADDPVVAVAALSYDAREELNAGMAIFLRALLARTYNTERNPAAKTIVEIGHGAGSPDANAFLKQAAVFHADVAAYGDRLPVHSTGVARAAPPRTEQLQIGGGLGTTKIERDEPVSPLLTKRPLVLNQDGEVLGETAASWNWPFARSLLDLVDAGRAERSDSGAPRSARDPFISAWYHATTAYMFAGGAYGDLTPHLQHAADVLPDDARLLFDRGCYAEVLGLPMHQTLSLPIPSAEKTNAEAERLFRRAFTIDPSLVESRVRWARLLDLRNRHKEAADELKTVLAENPRGVVAFYADLFAGRVAQTMGQADEASRHYRDALALFPDAQSALLASSQLALLGSDLPASLLHVDRLGARTAVFTADPWWQYHLCAGRDADDLLTALWSSMPRSVGAEHWRHSSPEVTRHK